MKIKLGLYLKELLLFGATLLIGIFSAYRNITSSVPIMIPEIKFGWGDAIFLAVLALFFIFFSKYQRVVSFSFKLFLVLIIFSGTSAVMSTVFNPPWDIWITFLVVAVFMSVKNVLVHNVGIILAVAGIGSLLGLAISPGIAVVAMVILSFYDIIAVYVTKHMVRMAKTMMESGAIFGFLIPSQVSGFFSHKGEAQAQVGVGGQFMVLGSGDIGLPVVLASSVVRYSLSGAIVVAVFSLAGLFITHLIFVNQQERRPMAALPPIATMSIIGYLITTII
jgi:presenilin-like A22 family membrane protease